MNEKFPNFYDTSKTVYINNVTKLTLIHDGHEIVTTPMSIFGNKKPILQNKVFDTNTFIEKAKKVHNDEYIYDEKTVYTTAHKKIIVKCKKHGYFEVIAANHLNGAKCSLCRKETKLNPKRKTFEQFINEALERHGDKYTYDESTFKNYNTKMKIICPIHGEFYQKPSVHIRGDKGHGCPKCKESRLERSMSLILNENNIKYETAKHFDWLGRQHFDFYLPDYNVAIECQGKQHFIDGGWNKNGSLNLIIKRDLKKFKKSINNVRILYLLDSNISRKSVINNEKYGFIYDDKNTFKTKEQLITYINKALIL